MQNTELNDPILIAAWPGMGHVAVTACYYLIAKLEMEFRMEYAASELFDVDHVAITSGLVQPFRYPKNQFFVWRNSNGGRDLLVFLGEAQPPLGRYNFCRKLIDFAQSEGVSKVFTFAAMATTMDLKDDSGVIGVATDKVTLHELLEKEVGLLKNGTISGMNGILLGVAAERKIQGGCLLGEMPNNLVGVPYPKAALAVLDAFCRITGVSVDMSELKLEVQRMENYLTEAITQIQKLEQQSSEGEFAQEEETIIAEPKLTDEEHEMLERLFDEASHVRSKAYELKRELDRLEVFREYEDRFLDLFKNMESETGEKGEEGEADEDADEDAADEDVGDEPDETG